MKILTVIYQKAAFFAVSMNYLNSDLLHLSFGKSVGGPNIKGGQNISVIFWPVGHNIMTHGS